MFEDLIHRANVTTRCYHHDKQIVIYDDHRWILNVLFKWYKEKQTSINIVSFDAHDDAAGCANRSSLLELIGVTDLKGATERQFSSFVEYDIGTQDDDWLTVACKLDLINDSCTIGNVNNSNILNMGNELESESGRKHSLYELSYDLNVELGCRGKLGDACKYDKNKGVRKFFGIEQSYNHCIGKMKPFILDFDLDFFTISSNDLTFAWPDKMWNETFGNCSKARFFMQQLIEKAELITICREPDYCGSIAESNQILRTLDYIFFDGCLGA